MSLPDDIAESLPSPQDKLLADMARSRERVERKQEKAAYEAALCRIVALEEQVALLTALNERKVQKPLKPSKRTRGDATAVLVLSDWHVEERVDPKTVNGLNEFNLDIAEKWANRVFEKCLLLLEDARGLAQVNELYVALLGDFISGFIHEELVEGNQLAPLPATMFAADLIERGLRTLLAHARVDRIIVPTCHGNHGRTTPKMRIATSAANSFERNMYAHLARRFQHEPRIDWRIGDGYHNIQTIQGRDFRFHHGENIKYNGGVGGITIPMNKAVAQWNKSRRAYYDIAGHLHAWTNNWNWHINGSLIGYGAFSVAIKGDYQPPVQTFIVVDKDRGVTRTLPVFCD